MNTKRYLPLALFIAGSLPPLVSLAGSGNMSPDSPRWERMSDEERAKVMEQRLLDRLDKNPYGQVEGVITDLNGLPIADVDVWVGDMMTTTDEDGAFLLEEVPFGSYIVIYEHPDYVSTQRHAFVQPADTETLFQTLLERAPAQTIRTDRVSKVSAGALTLTFEPGDLVYAQSGAPVRGEVSVQATTIDPRIPGHLDAAPAQLEGLNTQEEFVGLFSYGMMEVELSQGGQKVQVRRGETVTSEMEVGGYGLASGAQIPMWHHDELVGAWVQEDKVNAQVVQVGKRLLARTELPHFSKWNYDSEQDAVCVQLRFPVDTAPSKLRVIGTTGANTTVDTSSYAWNLTSTCSKDAMGRVSCMTNFPIRSNGGTTDAVYFKVQASDSAGTYRDLTIKLYNDTTEYSYFSASTMRSYLTTNATTLSGGSWCGSASVQTKLLASASAKGTFDLGSTTDSGWVADDFLRGIVVSSTSGKMGLSSSSVTDSTNYKTLYSNSSSSTYKADIDRDGVADYKDNCALWSNKAQTDSDKDGIGDACESMCYVSSSSADAALYDYDGDEVDDYCDNDWTVYNPSQYKP